MSEKVHVRTIVRKSRRGGGVWRREKASVVAQPQAGKSSPASPKLKVKIFRRKTDGNCQHGAEESQRSMDDKIEKKRWKQQRVLKRKLETVLETTMELTTRPRTYTYFVTRKNGAEGTDEFISSNTEIRDFTYPITVTKTAFRRAEPILVTESVRMHGHGLC